MLNRYHLLTAVCVAASTGLFVMGPALADDLSPTGNAGNVSPSRETEADVSLPAGIEAKNLNSDKSIEHAFKAVTDDAMSKTGLDNLVDRLVDQDRDRIKKSLNSGTLNNIDGTKNKQLTDLIADIEGTWKTKYNQNFNLDIGKVYTGDFLHIQTGEVVDANQLVGKWPVDAAINAPKGGKLTPQEAQDTKGKTFGGDVNLEKGRNVAIVHIMGKNGYAGLNASLIHEVGVGWKFDVPNTVTANSLYDNLCKNLSYFDQKKDSWPTDANESYRLFSHLVVASLYGVPVTPTNSPMPSGGANR